MITWAVIQHARSGDDRATSRLAAQHVQIPNSTATDSVLELEVPRNPALSTIYYLSSSRSSCAREPGFEPARPPTALQHVDTALCPGQSQGRAWSSGARASRVVGFGHEMFHNDRIDSTRRRHAVKVEDHARMALERHPREHKAYRVQTELVNTLFHWVWAALSLPFGATDVN
ncbi:BZ3500_MvSof-1268-A1-R1_Chr11-1g03287 [Microbotryum saponariae]|uniref:BZ3500_MvSof-1268-A1-R1_Chr11-1g03287 protein n=1 Tax=Microbotryum saponariae TaxID=289078 RepID=A0A2X0LFM3_9BASI|nr:BZ3501_MvSof-1269-A2-R1_Chr11g02862 [Microbotryum saponariae]SDA03890.1 BZ3500_MvSof-1268-A1-R1_Chr11-1g03287 [Microbotryum saponariae]